MTGGLDLITDPVVKRRNRLAIPVGGGFIRQVILGQYVCRTARLGLMSAASLLLVAAAVFAAPAGAGAVDLGTPSLSAPLHLEKFFDTERLTTGGGNSAAAPGFLEPQLGLSHMAREDEGEGMTTQTTHRVHGEAGGKLNLLENLSLTAVAKLPLYTHETRWGQTMSPEGRSSADIMSKPANNLSWRSEVGVNLGQGIDINLFYDRSMFDRIDKPGVEETDERFGTRFIIRFK